MQFLGRLTDQDFIVLTTVIRVLLALALLSAAWWDHTHGARVWTWCVYDWAIPVLQIVLWVIPGVLLLSRMRTAVRVVSSAAWAIGVWATAGWFPQHNPVWILLRIALKAVPLQSYPFWACSAVIAWLIITHQGNPRGSVPLAATLVCLSLVGYLAFGW